LRRVLRLARVACRGPTPGLDRWVVGLLALVGAQARVGGRRAAVGRAVVGGVWGAYCGGGWCGCVVGRRARYEGVAMAAGSAVAGTGVGIFVGPTGMTAGVAGLMGTGG
jgi:hypothetical protein